MWWLEPVRGQRVKNVAAALFLAVTLGGCFQPLYGDLPLGRTSVRDALREVEVAPIDGRVPQELRNDLIFELTGGDGNPIGAPYRLNITVSSGIATPPIIDPATGIAAVEIVSLNVTYRLLEVGSNKTVVNDRALARITVDRSLQRFARYRGVRDAENRAAKSVAEQIRARLASYFLTKS
jgi:LPS-assembly lipoprotein